MYIITTIITQALLNKRSEATDSAETHEYIFVNSLKTSLFKFFHQVIKFTIFL